MCTISIVASCPPTYKSSSCLTKSRGEQKSSQNGKRLSLRNREYSCGKHRVECNQGFELHQNWVWQPRDADGLRDWELWHETLRLRLFRCRTLCRLHARGAQSLLQPAHWWQGASPSQTHSNHYSFQFFHPSVHLRFFPDIITQLPSIPCTNWGTFLYNMQTKVTLDSILGGHSRHWNQQESDNRQPRSLTQPHHGCGLPPFAENPGCEEHRAHVPQPLQQQD